MHVTRPYLIVSDADPYFGAKVAAYLVTVVLVLAVGARKVLA